MGWCKSYEYEGAHITRTLSTSSQVPHWSLLAVYTNAYRNNTGGLYIFNALFSSLGWAPSYCLMHRGTASDHAHRNYSYLQGGMLSFFHIIQWAGFWVPKTVTRPVYIAQHQSVITNTHYVHLSLHTYCLSACLHATWVRTSCTCIASCSVLYLLVYCDACVYEVLVDQYSVVEIKV